MSALGGGGVCVASGMALLAGEGRKGASPMHLGKSLRPFFCPIPTHAQAPAQASPMLTWKFPTACSRVSTHQSMSPSPWQL